MAFDKKKFIAKFAEEAMEHISHLNNGLLSLEKNPGDMEVLTQIFRSAHTIKGSSSILDLKPISRLAHKLEDILDALRSGKINQSRPLFNLIFNAVDMITEMVLQTQDGEEISADPGELCANLELALKGEIVAPPNPPSAGDLLSADAPLSNAANTAGAKDVSDILLPSIEPEKLKEVEIPSVAAQTASKSRIDESVRIPVAKLDSAIKLMGEVISNHNILKQKIAELESIQKFSGKLIETISKFEKGEYNLDNGHREELFHAAHSLNTKIKTLASAAKDAISIQALLTDDLGEKVLQMRMLPLSTVLDSLPRLVRSIAEPMNKKVKLALVGGETELDKKIIEKIGDPLLHMIRNSIDHGIEYPEERVKAGKSETGTIKIAARYESGNVLIELSDDGQGINLQKVREKALQKKMLDEAALKDMPELELIQLIFHPGFSTSPIITDISGRGVGMDVVKENIVERLKGSIQITTVPGQGATFYIRLPLTMAVMRILQVTLGESLFAIPVSSVWEILRIPASEIIDVVDKKAIRLREQILPVAYLDDILGLAADKPAERKDLIIVMVAMGSEKMGLVVDSLVSEEDMEIKPLPPHMKNIELIAGASVSGKNEILLLLHVPKIFAIAKEIKKNPQLEKNAEEERRAKLILVVDDSVNTREIEKSILESYGYNVHLAMDGQDGYEKAMQTQYDLVVTDIEMPRLDGFSLTEKLRQEHGYKHTPIIIVSSRDKDEDKRRGIKVGANAYIIKGSFDQSNLLNTVQSLIV